MNLILQKLALLAMGGKSCFLEDDTVKWIKTLLWNRDNQIIFNPNSIILIFFKKIFSLLLSQKTL